MSFKKMHFLLVLLFPMAGLFAQSSYFDIDAESWTGAGDPASTVPTYFNSGGNPGGYIRLNDAATGGLWYFLPPPKFQGNRCDAYGRFMRYDQFTNDTTGQSTFASAWDIMIEGGNGMDLFWDHAVLPGEDWTHFDVLLKEDAGWLIRGSNNPPTETEFRAVLGDIERIRILGEYHVGFDYGGMDNFIFESNYALDLDEDDSTTERGSWDFWQDSTCNTTIPIVGDDVLVAGDPVFSQIEVSLPPFGIDANLENLIAMGLLPNTITMTGDGTDNIILTNTGLATNADFVAALQTIFFQSTSPNPASAVRIVVIEAKPDCGDGIIETKAFLPLYPTPPAGADQVLNFCASDGPTNVQDFFDTNTGQNGFWSPNFLSGTSVFDPFKDKEGTYRYITSSAADCPRDTAIFEIRTVAAFDLGPDTLLCQDSSLQISLDLSDYDTWVWENGSFSPNRSIFETGLYSIVATTGDCVFSDSIQVSVTACTECAVFAPNIFKPNLSGLNDAFRIEPNCPVAGFRLQIFDRWGSLVFESADPNEYWFGFYKEKEAFSDIYIWQVQFETEVFGEKVLVQKSGDVLLIR